MIKKDKKGFLLGEYTLKVIIAVLSISLLLYLLFVLYGSYNSDQKLNQAEATLNDIVEKMGLAKEGVEQDVVLLSPSKWLLLSYKKGDEKRPLGCKESCVCVCDDKLVGAWMASDDEKRIALSKICDDDKVGVCKNVDDKINGVYIKIPKDIQIKYTNDGFIINEK